MTKACAGTLVALFVVFLEAPPASPEETPAATWAATWMEISGVVADEVGRPLRGATVSVFASGAERSALTVITDEHGRFRVTSLNPGLYRLRAYLSGFFPSRYAKVLIEEGAERAGAVLMRLASLESMDDFVAETDETRTLAELRWLLQHEERNILKNEEHGATVAELASWDEAPTAAPPSSALAVSGEFGVRAAAYDEGLDLFPGSGAGLDARLAYARLFIPTKEDGRWLVSAQLLESALSSWAGSAEYASGDVSGHQLAAGVTYGNYLYGDLQAFRPPEAALTKPLDGNRSREWFGSVYTSDDFELGSAAVSVGLAYEYFDYLDRSGYASPRAAIAVPIEGLGGETILRGAAELRTQAPGGEDLGLLSQMAFDIYGPTRERSSVRAQTTARLALGLDRRLGEGSVVTMRLFEERSTDQLLKTYVKDRPELSGGAGYFAVSNQGDFRTRGLGVSLSQSFGGLESSVGYTFGLARALAAERLGAAADEEIHDLTTTVATSIDRTQTRLQAAYRLIAHPRLSHDGPGFSPGTSLDSRFSVQVYQLLPFVGWNGTSWEVMIAVRNLFYEDLEGASMLDELAVLDAPRRVVGGVTVRF